MLNATALQEPKTFPGLTADSVMIVKVQIGKVVFFENVTGAFCTRLHTDWLRPASGGPDAH